MRVIVAANVSAGSQYLAAATGFVITDINCSLDKAVTSDHTLASSWPIRSPAVATSDFTLATHRRKATNLVPIEHGCCCRAKGIHHILSVDACTKWSHHGHDVILLHLEDSAGFLCILAKDIAKVGPINLLSVRQVQ